MTRRPIHLGGASFAGAALLALAGCAAGPADDPRLDAAIARHYAAHATEERGACRSPRIDTILERRPLERSTGGMEVVVLRYSYFDPNADMDARFDKLVHLSQPCGGIAERRFVLARGERGYRVAGMGGERRGGGSDR